MAYTPGTLNLSVDSIAGGSLRIHFYRTADSEDDVTVTDYFAGAGSRGVRAGDVIIIHFTTDNSVQIAEVSAVDADGNATIVINRNLLQEYANFAAVEAITVPPAIDSIRIHGHDAAGDLGGGNAYRQASEPTYGPKVQDASGAWFWIKEPKLDIRQFGAFGSDDEDSLVDESTEIEAALTAAAMTGKELLVPSDTHFQLGGFSLNNTRVFMRVSAASQGRAFFHATDALAESGSYLMRFERTAYDIESGVITVAADILPNQKQITLSSVASLAPGMMIQIVSDQEWYYSESGDTRRCGEIHRIARVLSATNEIEVDDITWDFYDISADTVVVRAWWPSEFTMENIGLIMPLPANLESPRCLRLDTFYRPTMSTCLIKGGGFFGFDEQRNWLARFDDIEIEDTGGGDSDAGYSMQVRSSYGGHISRLKTRGGRAAIDFHSRSGDTGNPTRGYLIEDFHITGGGAEFDGDEYFPEPDDVQNRGISTHGPSENLRIRNGFITAVETGIRIRGRDTSISGVHFYGPMETCIYASQGTGLKIDNNWYERGDYPDKVASGVLGSKAPSAFIRLGVNTDISAWDYDSPTVVTNNTAHGIAEAFLRFGHTNSIRNVTARNNSVITHVPSGGTFNFFDSVDDGGSRSVHKAFLDKGSNYIQNYDTGTCNLFDSQIALGSVSTGGADAAVRVSDRTWSLSIGDDAYARILNFGRAGERLVVHIVSSTSSIYGAFIIVPSSATLITLGAIGSNVEATASADSITGTFGTDVKVTFGLNASGTLYIENRIGFTISLRISAIA